jgi:hypothetical protein
MNNQYQLPDSNNPHFARTNIQTIHQRASILKELLPDMKSVAEICCGDCYEQDRIYREVFGIEKYIGLDIQTEIVKLNRSRGVSCMLGDALDKNVLPTFLGFDVIFYGPPLSVHCDGHNLLAFREIVPGYQDFVGLLLGELKYSGTLVCICPRDTTMGDVRLLYEQVKSLREDFGLRLSNHNYSTITGSGKTTELRLKYVELWFSSILKDSWEIRESKPNSEEKKYEEKPPQKN